MLQGKPSVFPLGSLEHNTPRLYPALLPNQGIIFQTASSSLFFGGNVVSVSSSSSNSERGNGGECIISSFGRRGKSNAIYVGPCSQTVKSLLVCQETKKTTHQSSWQIKEGANESVNRLIIQRNLILKTIPPNERNLQTKSAKKKTSKQEDDQHFIRKLI